MRSVILKREKRILSYFKFRVFETSSFVPWKPWFFAWSIITFRCWIEERKKRKYIQTYIHIHTHTHIHTRTITMILINVNGFSLLYYRCYLIIYLQIIKREFVVVLFINLDCPNLRIIFGWFFSQIFASFEIFLFNLLSIFFLLILSFVFIFCEIIWKLLE